ncbi:hypothetical protein WI664_10330 [Vibrio cholerae]
MLVKPDEFGQPHLFTELVHGPPHGRAINAAEPVLSTENTPSALRPQQNPSFVLRARAPLWVTNAILDVKIRYARYVTSLFRPAAETASHAERGEHFKRASNRGNARVIVPDHTTLLAQYRCRCRRPP